LRFQAGCYSWLSSHCSRNHNPFQIVLPDKSQVAAEEQVLKEEKHLYPQQSGCDPCSGYLLCHCSTWPRGVRVKQPWPMRLALLALLRR
jgi:hypothetical protein